MQNEIEEFYEKYCVDSCHYQESLFTELHLSNNEVKKVKNALFENQCIHKGFCCSHEDYPKGIIDIESNVAPDTGKRKQSKNEKGKHTWKNVALIVTVIASLLVLLIMVFNNRAVFTIYTEQKELEFITTLVSNGGAVSNVRCYLSGYFKMQYCDEVLIIPIETRHLQYDYIDNKLHIKTLTLDDLIKETEIYKIFYIQLLINTQIEYGTIIYDSSYFDGIYQKPQNEDSLRNRFLLNIQFTDANNIRQTRIFDIYSGERLNPRDIPSPNINGRISTFTTPEQFFNLINSNLPSSVPPFAYFMIERNVD